MSPWTRRFATRMLALVAFENALIMASVAAAVRIRLGVDGWYTFLDEHGLARLQALNDRMRALPEEDPRYADLNREFHFTVYEYARSPLLLTLMRLLWASLQGGPRVLRSHAESARQHDAILAALRGGDAAAASDRTYQHIMGAAH